MIKPHPPEMLIWRGKSLRNFLLIERGEGRRKIEADANVTQGRQASSQAVSQTGQYPASGSGFRVINNT